MKNTIEKGSYVIQRGGRGGIKMKTVIDIKDLMTTEAYIMYCVKRAKRLLDNYERKGAGDTIQRAIDALQDAVDAKVDDLLPQGEMLRIIDVTEDYVYIECGQFIEMFGMDFESEPDIYGLTDEYSILLSYALCGTKYVTTMNIFNSELA